MYAPPRCQCILKDYFGKAVPEHVAKRGLHEPHVSKLSSQG